MTAASNSFPSADLAASGRAREYLRVSHDKSGRMRSPAEQHDDNAAAAEREGWTLGAPYAEREAVGASRYSKGVRAAFAALTADLEAGRFGAEILIMWESGRGSRRLSEWARFLELLEENGVRLYVTTHGRLYDLANPRDRRMMQEEGPDNEYFIEKLRAGVLRGMSANAAAGRPQGPAPYGFLPERDRRGKLVTWVRDPERAPVIVELFDRVAKGHSITGIAKDFERRGIFTKKGTPFHPAHLRRMLTKVAYIGKRSHYGDVVEATWEALVDEEIFYTVQRIINNPARAVARHGRGVHEYTMIIRCDPCGGPLVVNIRDGNRRPEAPRYQCVRKGCVRIPKAGVDELLTDAIIGYLSSGRVYEDFAARPEDAGRAEQLRGELAQARMELQEAEAAEPETLYEAKALGKLVERLAEKVTRLEAEERELTMPAELRDFVEPGADVAARWRDAPVAAKRSVAARLLAPGVLGEVRVKRAPVRGRTLAAADRVLWRRDDG